MGSTKLCLWDSFGEGGDSMTLYREPFRLLRKLLGMFLGLLER